MSAQPRSPGVGELVLGDDETLDLSARSSSVKGPCGIAHEQHGLALRLGFILNSPSVSNSDGSTMPFHVDAILRRKCDQPTTLE
jgi:hypothetical protein